MAILVKLSLASLIAGWLTLAMNLPRPILGSQQQAMPSPSTDTGKQPDTPAKLVQPQPKPDASGNYHVGNGVSTPRLVYSEGPEFPYKLQKRKILGSCTLSITVDTDGKSHDVRIIKSFPDTNDKKLRGTAIEMQNNCIQSAKQYRFEPATYQGKPVPVELSVEIAFQIF
jgi:TonB family protein